MSSTLADAYDLIQEKKSYFPSDYKSSPIFVGTAAQSIQPETYLQASRFDTAPVMMFKGERHTYTASKPILVKVYRDEDIFFAENDSLVLCGTGDSREDAILDFVKHLEYFYNFYKRQSEGNLRGDALRLKKIYSDLVVEA